MNNPQYFPELSALKGVPLHTHGSNDSGNQPDDTKVDKTTTVAGKPLTGNITLVKADVGLSSVDNTADAAKPVSTATNAALSLKASLASPAFTGTPTGITKVHIGLANVDNTTDLAKPISTLTQTALNAKLTATKAAAQANFVGADIDALKIELNDFLAKLKAANLVT